MQHWKFYFVVKENSTLIVVFENKLWFYSPVRAIAATSSSNSEDLILVSSWWTLQDNLYHEINLFNYNS